MSQTTKKVGGLHRITVRNKSPGKILSGATTEVLLDGELLRGTTYFKLEIKPRKIAKLTIELLVGEVEVEGDYVLEQSGEARPLEGGKKFLVGRFSSIDPESSEK